MFNPSPVAPKPDLQPLSAPRVKGLKISLGFAVQHRRLEVVFLTGRRIRVKELF